MIAIKADLHLVTRTDPSPPTNIGRNHNLSPRTNTHCDHPCMTHTW